MPGKKTKRRSTKGADPFAVFKELVVAAFHDEKVHAGFAKIFADVPSELRGARPEGQPFTLWQLLEHLRLCVLDFLDSCRVPGYVEPKFPEGYWPASDTPASNQEWEQSVREFRSSLRTLEKLLLNPSNDLVSVIPGSNGRTALRQALACLDHNAYHLGQAVLLRRLLGIWE
ncbi:MAG: DinB family protein [Terriglobia bacterium]